MTRTLPSLALVATVCLSVPFSHADQPFRRRFAAADMKVVGKGYRRNRVTAIDVKFSDEKAAAAGGLLEKNMGRELPAGKYLVFVGVRALKPRRVPVDLEIGLGRTKINTKTPAASYGDTAIVVDAAESWRKLTLDVKTPRNLIRVSEIYVSNRPDDLDFDRARKRPRIQYDRVARDMRPETAVGSDVPEPPNYIVDGSFETGMPTYMWSTFYGSSYCIRPENWDASQRFSGERSLRLPLFAFRMAPERPSSHRLISRVLKLKPGRTYTFSGMVKADRPVRLDVSCHTAYGKGVRLGAARLNVASEWQRLAMPIRTTDDDRGCQLYLAATGTGETVLWADDLCLSAEKTKRFVPAAPVEVGIHWNVAGKVFHVEEPAHFRLTARNHSDKAAEVRVRYRVIDYFDRTVLDESTRGWRVAPGSAGRDLDLNTGRTGCFRLLIDGSATPPQGEIKLPLREYAFAVLHRPPKDMVGNLGAFITLARDPVIAMSRAGIRRTVTLSCANSLLEEWRSIEPEPGRYVWWDDAVDLARRNHMEITANLHSDYPKWALNPADPGDVLEAKGVKISRKAWMRFIEKTVAHYRGAIRDWIIIDEPYYRFTAEQYAELLKATYPAAKRGNPDCRILAHGGYYDPWLPGLVKAGAVDFFDGISDYARNKHQGNRLKKFRDRYGKFIYAAEYGQHMSLYRTIEAPNNPKDRTSPTVYTANTEDVVGKAIRGMCWAGAVGYHRYDARFPGGDFTKLDRHKCMFEYDGGLKPPAVAYAVAAQLLDGFQGVAEIELHEQLETFLLQDSDRFALVIMTRDGAAQQTDLTTPEGVKLYDIMGNVLPPEGVVLHKAVTYLIGPKAQQEATQRMVGSLRLSPVVSITTSTRLDTKTDQYVLEARITNRSPKRTLDGLVDIDRGRKPYVRRDFWAGPATVTQLAPGRSATVRFGLNSYKGDELKAGACEVVFVFDGITARQSVPNACKLGRH